MVINADKNELDAHLRSSLYTIITHRVNFESPAKPRYLEGGAINRVGSLPQGTVNTQTNTLIKPCGHKCFHRVFTT